MKKRRNIYPEIGAFLLFLIYMIPFALVVINSAKPSLMIIMDPLSLPKNPAQLLSNIKTVIESPNVQYLSSFVSTIIITVVSVGLLVLISSMAAWVLVRTKTALSNIVFMVFVAAMVIPFQVVMFPLISWFHMIEVGLGLMNTPFRLLQNYPGIILAYLGFGSSLSVFLFHGFIKSVPLELEEAATIDGCSKPGIFFRIVFPILTPITVTVIILNGIWIWNDYLLPLMVLGSGNAVRTLPLAVAGFVGSFVKKWDLILTATMMTMLPIIIVFLILQKYIIKGMVEGSVKG
ncbi:MAG: carbohydrate ABC transporter permease [Spirochaetaceae bacterium]|jgi:raffinose/stachyose/melibiose transport system permease protein|nr:carbohydrate ABC transporter permease [Spirochaetaceae bacterium]